MSKQPKRIDAYLAATRSVLAERVTGARYSNVEALFARDLYTRPPQLVVTYSYLGATEIVSNGDDRYVVYDQFAGDCFARLNWLFATRVPKVQDFCNLVLGQKLIHTRADRPRARSRSE